MISPQDHLQEYLNGIQEVLNQNPPEEELKELNRQKTIFTSAIWSIQHALNKASDHSSRGRIFTTEGRISAIIQAQDIEIDNLNKQLKEKYAKIISRWHNLYIKNYCLKKTIKKLRERNNKLINI